MLVQLIQYVIQYCQKLLFYDKGNSNQIMHYSLRSIAAEILLSTVLSQSCVNFVSTSIPDQDIISVVFYHILHDEHYEVRLTGLKMLKRYLKKRETDHIKYCYFNIQSALLSRLGLSLSDVEEGTTHSYLF